MEPLPNIPNPQPTPEQIRTIGAALSEAAAINVRLCAETMGVSLDTGIALQSMLYAASQVVVNRPGPTTDEIEIARRNGQAQRLFREWMRGFSEWCRENGFEYQNADAQDEPNETN